MFYSAEILGRRSPLGAIWIAAHGKKLNRNKVLSVNIADICDKVMDPEIPQALRLQGILIGGVVIIFNKQQHYLLDDCNDTMRKMQGLANQQRATNTLAKDKQRARPEKITLQGLDLMGLDDNMASANLLEDALHALDTSYNPMTGDDFFEMQTLESTMDVPTPGMDNMDSGISITPNPRAGMADIDFDAALTLDQPERFDGPDMDMDPPDMTQEPFMHTPEAGQEDQARATAQDMDMEGPPQDMGPPADSQRSPYPQPGADSKETSIAAQNVDMQPEDVPLTPAVAEEDHPPAAAQARKKGKRKAIAGPVLDPPEQTLVERKVYREWTTNREPILTERPHRASPTPPASNGPFQLLPNPCMGAWPSQILDLLHSRIELPRGPKKARSAGSDAKSEPIVAGEATAAEIGQLFEDAGDILQADDAADFPMHRNMDSPLEDMLEADIPGDEELQAIADEEGMPVEQLRAAVETPQAAADHLKAMQQGMESGSSKHSSLASLLKRRVRASSKGRSSSATKPATSDRSLGSTVRRLSDVREDEALMDLDMPAGDLDALLPDLAEAEEPAPHNPGLLTQFQMLGDSLMVASERQTQPTQHAILNKNTVAIMKALQKQFAEQEKATGGTPSLSVDVLTAAMAKREAARIFYQICAVTSLGFVAATQEKAYGDIMLTPGTKYTIETQ